MKAGDVLSVTVLGYGKPWRCRVVSRRVPASGNVRVEWLDGPLAGREANIAREFLR